MKFFVGDAVRIAGIKNRLNASSGGQGQQRPSHWPQPKFSAEPHHVTRHVSTARHFHYGGNLNFYSTQPKLTHRNSHLFLDRMELQSIDGSVSAPMQEKTFGRAQGSVVSRKKSFDQDTQEEFYLVKTAFDLHKKQPCHDNIKIRAEQLNREIIAVCMEPYADIFVPETFIVVEPLEHQPLDERRQGYVHEWLASRICALEQYPTQDNKVRYSMHIQDFLRERNFLPFTQAFLPLAFNESWDHPGVYFSNVGKGKGTEQFVLLDFGVGSGTGQLGVPPFKSDTLIKTLDNMRYFDENGKKISGWERLQINNMLDQYGYYTHEVYPLDCARDIFQKHFTVGQCVKGINLTPERLKKIMEHVSAPVEWKFDDPKKQQALEVYNQSLSDQKEIMSKTYTRRLSDMQRFVDMVRFLYPEHHSDHNQLLPSAFLIEQRYNTLVQQYGSTELDEVTPEVKHNITKDLLRLSGLERDNEVYQYNAKQLGKQQSPRQTGLPSL